MKPEDKTWQDWEVLAKEETTVTFTLLYLTNRDFREVLTCEFFTAEDIIQEPTEYFSFLVELGYYLGFRLNKDFTHVAITGLNPRDEEELMHIYDVKTLLRDGTDGKHFDDIEYDFVCRNVIGADIWKTLIQLSEKLNKGTKNSTSKKTSDKYLAKKGEQVTWLLVDKFKKEKTKVILTTKFCAKKNLPIIPAQPFHKLMQFAYWSGFTYYYGFTHLIAVVGDTYHTYEISARTKKKNWTGNSFWDTIFTFTYLGVDEKPNNLTYEEPKTEKD